MHLPVARPYLQTIFRTFRVVEGGLGNIFDSRRHSIYFQCVPSHIGLNGNEIADSLAKSATADTWRDTLVKLLPNCPPLKG
ncbi:hypothetical protein TNCV_5019581 [Trichonephila clavipes]|nr:hypothetical protein TNCV_5019581 [Trichonephila clavipes]